jgi:hypothetical protein
MPPRPALAVLLVVLLAAGCGLDDDEQTAADNLSALLVAPGAGEADRDAAGCIAEKWVGEVGTDALVDAGLLDEDLEARRPAVRRLVAGELPVSREVAAGLAASRLDCADFDALALDQKRDHPDASAEELDEYADCLKLLDQDDWRASMVAYYTGKPAPGLEEFRLDLRSCNEMLAATDR